MSLYAVVVAGLLLVLGLFAGEAEAQQGKPKVPPQLPSQAAEQAQQKVSENTAPTVSLTAPANDALYTAPATVPLEASAAASSGGRSITQVEFFAGGNFIGTATTAPYAFTWTPVAAGTYSLTARATDNLGVTATSAPVSIIVNAPPSVDLTAPANNALFTAPATIELTAAAADTDGSVDQVEFFRGTTLVATVTSGPYTFSLTNVAAGSLTFTARATDDRGAVTTSIAVAVLVNAPPSVSLTSPSTNDDFRAPASITLTAEATDSDGTIANVQFYNGTTLIATRTEPPYSIIWSGVPAGSYSLTARVMDNLGAATTSDATSVTVTQALAQIYYIHTDHLNTPRAIYDQQQRLVWRWDQTDPFGGNPPNENPSGLGSFTCNLRLPGQYFDKETSNHYNYFRDYDPAIGRYIQSDPIGLEGGINTYAYVLGDPLGRSDAEGLFVEVKCRLLARAGRVISRQIFGTPQKHCFVYVGCPEENWSTVLSLQGNLWPLPVFSTGRKVQASPLSPVEGDDPFSPTVQTVPIVPKKPGCIPCAYEKDIITKFNNVPSGNIPYDELGPNSNTFTSNLVTNPAFGAAIPSGAISNAPGLFGTPPTGWTR